MKMNKIISVLSIGLIIGSVVGVVNSIYYIIANQYIQQKMYRLVAFSFEKYLIKWITLFIIIPFAGIVILLLLLLSAKLIRIHVKDKNKLRTLLLAGIVCSTFFFYVGWILNHYCLPYKFHPVSILANLGILIFTIFLGWILTKVRWKTLCKVIERIKPDRKTVIALIMFLFIFKLCIVIDGKINAPEGPNVILLVVDSWRADSLGCYNENSNDTPNIDKFAENAILFKNFIAQSSCTINSAPSMFCSVYPYEHGYFNYNCIVSYKLNTLAELLRNEGYQTFGISTNPNVTHRNGLDQGFNVFIENFAWKNTDCDEVNGRFIKWLNKNKQKPFFAMIWYIDPHTPYDPPRAYIDKYISKKEEKELISVKTQHIGDQSYLTPTEQGVSKKLYAGEVNFFDTEFAKLINYLKQSRLINNSIVILTSDHGESFWEKKDPSGTPVTEHGSSLYEEQIKIPFILSLPNQQEGKVILEKAQHIDIVPTILEYVKTNSKITNKLPLRGDSLKGVINGKKLNRKYFLSQLIDQNDPYYMECIQTDNFKLISTQQCKDVRFTPSHLLFLNLNSGESEIDVTDEILNPKFTNLKRQLLSWEGSLENVKLTTKQIKHTSKREEEKLMERLKSLGYLQ